MRRHIALTGKIKLPASLVDVHVEDGPPRRVNVDASRLIEDLKKRAFAEESLIVLEAFRGFRYQRFSCGTLGAPGPFQHFLDEPLAICESISGRLKVVCPKTARILAEIPRFLLFRTGEGAFPRDSLLPVLDEDLGDLLFKVDFQDDFPKLCVNRRLHYRRFLSDTSILACVLQESIRTILMRLVSESREAGSDGTNVVDLEEVAEGDDWKSDWVRYMKRLGWSISRIDTSDPEEVEGAVDEGVEVFMRRHGFVDQVANELESEEA